MSHPKAVFVMRTAPILLMGSCFLSCVCIGNPGFPSRPFTEATPSESGPFAPTIAENSPESSLGDPYLAAVFPTGEEIYLLAPQPDAAVTTPWVDIAGTAPPETVLTLNDEISVAGSDGRFTARVPLEAGLNEILCTASDAGGNEVSFSILVAYEPEAE